MVEFDAGLEPAAFGESGDVGEVDEQSALVVEARPVGGHCHACALEFLGGDRGEVVDGRVGRVDRGRFVPEVGAWGGLEGVVVEQHDLVTG